MNESALDYQSKEQLESLRARVTGKAEKHEGLERFDGRLYNYGTAAVILLTSSAALLPNVLNNGGGVTAAASILSGLAAIWVAIDRSLHFGERWIHHREMAAEYWGIVDWIDSVMILPSENWHDEIKEIVDALQAIRRREASIPGARGARKPDD